MLEDTQRIGQVLEYVVGADDVESLGFREFLDWARVEEPLGHLRLGSRDPFAIEINARDIPAALVELDELSTIEAAKVEQPLVVGRTLRP